MNHIITAEEARTQAALDYTAKIQRRMNKIASDNKAAVAQIMNEIRAACNNGEYLTMCNVEIGYEAVNDIEWFLTQCGYKVSGRSYSTTATFFVDWRKNDETFCSDV